MACFYWPFLSLSLKPSSSDKSNSLTEPWSFSPCFRYVDLILFLLATSMQVYGKCYAHVTLLTLRSSCYVYSIQPCKEITFICLINVLAVMCQKYPWSSWMLDSERAGFINFRIYRLNISANKISEWISFLNVHTRIIKVFLVLRAQVADDPFALLTLSAALSVRQGSRASGSISWNNWVSEVGSRYLGAPTVHMRLFIVVCTRLQVLVKGDRRYIWWLRWTDQWQVT